MTPNPRKRLSHVLRQYSDPELLGDVAYVVAHTFGINEPAPGESPEEHEKGLMAAIKAEVHGVDFSGLRMVPTFGRGVYDCNFDGCVFEGGRFADTVNACSFVGAERVLVASPTGYSWTAPCPAATSRA